MLRFSDGDSFDTNMKPARPIKKRDGWYCAGYGVLIPCDDWEEANKEAERINKSREDEDGD